MESSKTISAALKLVDAKKQNLKKAFDELQSHSSLFSSSSSSSSPLPLSWSHIDAHFTTLHTTLNHRFNLLQSLETRHSKVQSFTPFSTDPSPQNDTETHSKRITELCQQMNATALRDYVGEHLNDKLSIGIALRSALEVASYPSSLILDSLDGVFGAKVVKGDKEVRKRKRSCNVLLRQFMVSGLRVSLNVREKAKRVYVEWRRSLLGDGGGGDGVGAMAFLHFVVAFGLLSELTLNEIVTFSAMVAANDELVQLYRSAGLTDKVPALVQKLLDKSKHILAVKYVCEFNLADKIPPVPILEAHVNESQKLVKRLSEERRPLNEITAREIHALKSVIKAIESHNLQSEYPPESLEQRIEQLMKHKANVKHAALAKPPQHQQNQSGKKHPRMSTLVGSAAVLNSVSGATSTEHYYQQPHFQSSGLLQEQHPHFQSPGLLPEHLNPYTSLPTMSYTMKAATPTILPYTGSSTGSYGLDGVPMGSSSNLAQGGSLPNSSESFVLSGYYDSVSANGGYGPQYSYHTSYPQ